MSENLVFWLTIAAGVMLVLLLALTIKSKMVPGTEASGTKAGRRPKIKKPLLTAEDVVAQRFMPTKFREGYAQKPVDELLEGIVLELRRLQEENERLQLRMANPRSEPVSVTDPILSPEQVVNQKFTPTKFREGYAQDEVDDFLDKVVLDLRLWASENDRLREQITGNVSL
jgi:DivIVA domain-containing protein